MTDTDSAACAHVRINLFPDLISHARRMSDRWKAEYLALPGCPGPEAYTPRMGVLARRQNQIESTIWRLVTKYGPPRAERLGALD